MENNENYMDGKTPSNHEVAEFVYHAFLQIENSLIDEGFDIKTDNLNESYLTIRVNTSMLLTTLYHALENVERMGGVDLQKIEEYINATGNIGSPLLVQ